ncbi:hypothetical protein PtA15_18A114 [Puccinia triticina]|uniref:HAT C-terminal dimerisation domain-containing protein n=1 Tax=Puccinia triticina TaxID=208348 RepID=A0ABY7D8Y7_9BASI|nr:uncharacterized protein PtA15_18A114 [Puccinia triticina]WAQ93058.1 hypothetical protein PtA15_18A114 [Puccinia triticina]
MIAWLHFFSERPPDPESKSDGDKFNFYPENSQAVQLNTEIERYTNGDFPIDKKGCVLAWWKAPLPLTSLEIVNHYHSAYFK